MPQIKDNGADVISRYCPIKLYFWDITESAEQLLGMLPSSYAYHEAVIARFRSEARRKEWLAVRVLLHRVADISEPIAYKESGGPYFVHTPLSVSISHTSHFACLALGNAAFGVDIEQYGAKASALTDKFLKPQEKNSCPKQVLRQNNLLCWLGAPKRLSIKPLTTCRWACFRISQSNMWMNLKLFSLFAFNINQIVAMARYGKYPMFSCRISF